VTAKQREHFRKLLVERLTDIVRTVQGDVRELSQSELIGQDGPGDEGDESTHTLMQDTRVRFAEVDAQRAQLIEAALARIRAGTYGECVDCGGPIELGRLEAVPWAVRCVDCQEAYEFDARDRSPSL
jgi:DnaK suppressor protein